MDSVVFSLLSFELSFWKAIRVALAIIIITARSDDVVRKAGGFYADDFIEKPFTTNDLKRRINNLLYQKK